MIILGQTLSDQALEPQAHEGEGRVEARYPRY